MLLFGLQGYRCVGGASGGEMVYVNGGGQVNVAAEVVGGGASVAYYGVQLGVGV